MLAEFNTAGNAEEFTLNHRVEGSLEGKDGFLWGTATTGDGARSTAPQIHKQFNESAGGAIQPGLGETFFTLEF